MSNTNYLKARLRPKYDTHADWLAKDTDSNPFIPMLNEPIFVNVGTDSNNIDRRTDHQKQTNDPLVQPTVMLKIGDGIHRYRELNWIGALAADVYDWAKQSSKPIYTENEIQNLVKMAYRGDITVSDFSSITNPIIGDVYNVTDSGTLLNTEITINAGDYIIYTENGWIKFISIGKPGAGNNSEIFNDYEGNNAISDYSHVEGYGNIAGTKCFAVSSVTENTTDNTSTYILDSVEGLEVGDAIEIFVLSSLNHITRIENIGTITSIDTDTKTIVTNTIPLVYPYKSSYIYYVRVKAKPTVGTLSTIEIASHAEGYITKANGGFAHSEGYSTTASGAYSHAEGELTESSWRASHAEGYKTKASEDYSHAEGHTTSANGSAAHSEGYKTQAIGDYSHSEGGMTQAKAPGSHTEGDSTIASAENQHVQGVMNIEDTESKYAHIVGNGSVDTNTRSNAHTLDWNGNAWYQGNVKIGGTSYDDASAKELATKEYVDDKATSLTNRINPIDDDVYNLRLSIQNNTVNFNRLRETKLNYSNYSTEFDDSSRGDIFEIENSILYQRIESFEEITGIAAPGSSGTYIVRISDSIAIDIINDYLEKGSMITVQSTTETASAGFEISSINKYSSYLDIICTVSDKKPNTLTAKLPAALAGNYGVEITSIQYDDTFYTGQKVINNGYRFSLYIDTPENYVKKEQGKGLSQNDYTDNDKAKLDTMSLTDLYGTSIVNINGGLSVSGGPITLDSETSMDSRNLIFTDQGNKSINLWMYEKLDKTDVLTKDNTTKYTPSADYNPATKKYVDDAVSYNKFTTISDTLTVNSIYDLGVQTSLSLTLPSGTTGDFIQVDFISIDTPTTLAITSASGLNGYDLTPEINRIYTLYFDWGAIGYSGNTVTYGWRYNYSEYSITN